MASIEQKYLELVPDSWEDLIGFIKYICPPGVKVTKAEVVKRDYQQKTVKDGRGKEYTSSKSETLRLVLKYKGSTSRGNESAELTRTFNPITNEWTPLPAYAAAMGQMVSYLFQLMKGWPEPKEDQLCEKYATSIELLSPAPRDSKLQLNCRVWRGFPDPDNNQVKMWAVNRKFCRLETLNLDVLNKI